MKTLPIASLALGVCLLALSAGVAFATNLHDPANTMGFSTTELQGQTGSNVLSSCGLVGGMPALGSSSTKTNSLVNGSGSAPGSPFNQSVSKKYAGNPGNNATNPKAVSQYDNACAQSQLH
jgi:hypothetical protein